MENTSTLEPPKAETKPTAQPETKLPPVTTGEFERKFKEAMAKSEGKPAETAAPNPEKKPEAKAGVETEPEEKPNPLLAHLTKKPETKAEEVKPDSVESEQAKTDSQPNSKETNLANLRKKADGLESELKTAREELKKAKETYPEDYAKLKEEHALMQAELKKHNLAATPDFQKKYDEKLKGSKTNLKRILNGTDVSADEFLKIVESPDTKERRAKIAELTSDMDDFSKQQVHAQIAAYDSVRLDREAELASPDQSLLQITERQQQEQAARIKEAEGIIDEIAQVAAQEISWLNVTDETPEEMRQEVKNINALASRIWKDSSTDPRARAGLVYAGAMYPTMQKMIGAAMEEIAKRDAQIARLRGSTPNLDANGKAPEQPKKAKGFIDHFNEVMEGKR